MEQLLEKYANLAVKIGVNIQQGQNLLVRANLETAPFVRKVVKKAYEAGANDVVVLWTDEETSRIRYESAPDAAFEKYPEYLVKAHDVAVDENWGLLSIVAIDPDLLKGIPAERIAAANKAAGLAMENFRQALMSDKLSWSIVAVPSAAWSAKVFPGLAEDRQQDALWEAIFKATRIDLEDPVGAWEGHIETLESKSSALNGKRFKTLHFKGPGTDLSIDLPEKHLWVAAGSINAKGDRFVANLPTEEVFTLPKKDGVNGVVASTKPLSYGGNLINNFSLTFEKGRIVEFSAEEGYETLKHLIDTDEGSHYLGEVALVAHDSPISNSNLVFFNTLFDENASVHLAIGSAYSFNLEGGKTMSKEELLENGANQSLTHVDFMIGSGELDIDGIACDGEIIPIFRKGGWQL
ncbi:MAG: aminopeptidase [Turicibacter sp.]|nr:aminopeptidase [Turicibacter sp.]